MTKLAPSATLVDSIVNSARDKGVAYNIIDDESLVGKHIHIRGKELVHFASCSYLGLELDERLKKGAIDAVMRYGTQFSCSKAYAAIPLYDEVEANLSQMFGKPVILAPTTSLGHIANLPVLISNEDAVIVDHQVHTSVQNAVQLVKARGVHVEPIRHSRMDMLESRIKELKDKYQKIWYLADGVYSMYGDAAPMAELYSLMDTYEQFHCYIDDAHGMSWTGRNGSGFALNGREYHPQMILITSLCKAFGVVGGAMIYPDEKKCNLLRNTASTIMFGGPIQPANLGASLESTKIHLSPEITERQDKLSSLLSYFILTAKSLNLPLVNDDMTPIFYFGVGEPDTGFEMCNKLMQNGFFTSIAAFPAVPYKNTGVRVSVNINHTVQDIYELLHCISVQLQELKSKDQYKEEKVLKAFNLPQ